MDPEQPGFLTPQYIDTPTPSEFWLDIGAGIEAEHWASTAASPGVRRVALDPLLTSGMVLSGRLPSLSPDICQMVLRSIRRMSLGQAEQLPPLWKTVRSIRQWVR